MLEQIIQTLFQTNIQFLIFHLRQNAMFMSVGPDNPTFLDQFT